MRRLFAASEIATWLGEHGEQARLDSGDVLIDGDTPLHLRHRVGAGLLECVHRFPHEVRGATEALVALGFLRANSTMPAPLLNIDPESARPLVRMVVLLGGDGGVDTDVLGHAIRTCRAAASQLEGWVASLCVDRDGAPPADEALDPPWWAEAPGS